MEYRWITLSGTKKLEERLTAELKISPLMARVLVNRGLSDPEQAQRYLNPKLKENHLHDPFLMKDMKPAVYRLLKALQRGEKILIYGDYDVDGLTSTALISSFLTQTDAQILTKIPNRLEDGYGLKEKYIREAKEKGVSLIVTVDCGISNATSVALANQMDIDVVITDHHEITGPLPPSYATINPKQEGCPFPFRDLAGVGVAFNLIIALRKEMRTLGLWRGSGEPNLKEYLDLVALGTIADMVPLTDENRVFVYFGLKELQRTKRPGLLALMRIGRIASNILDLRSISFVFAPRINAAGRLGDPQRALDLLLAENEIEALTIAQELDEKNRKRQKIEERIFDEARCQVEALPESAKKALILGSDLWHPGVIGIVASKLVERFYRPTILISFQDGNGKGSGRSIDSFDLLEGLNLCHSFLERFGGHRLAAGLEIRKDRLDAFRNSLNRIVENRVCSEDLVPVIHIDSQLSLSQLNNQLVEELENLAPFGPSNPEPVFSVDRIKICESRQVGKGHLQLKVQEDKRLFNAIGFGLGTRFSSIPAGDVSMAFVPIMDEWQGKRRMRLKVLDLKGKMNDA
jgi:single-stranded-DNA-specific exonuclease